MRSASVVVAAVLALCLPGDVAVAEAPAKLPTGLEELWKGADRCGKPTTEQWTLTLAMDYRLAAEVVSQAKVIPYRLIVEDLINAAKTKAGASTQLVSRRALLRSETPQTNIDPGAGGFPNVFGFTGHEMDRETGLIYMKARHYDPQTGLFLSEDPFEGSVLEPASLHRYLYAYANPTVYVDPDGRCVGKLQQTPFCQAIAKGLSVAVGGDPEARADYEIEKREKVMQGRREFRAQTGREPRPDEVVWAEGGRALTSDFREVDISGRIEPDHAEWTVVGTGIGTGLAVRSARAAGATTTQQIVAGAIQLGDDAVGELTGLSPRDAVDLSRLARERLTPRPGRGSPSGPSGVTILGESADRPGVELLPGSGPTQRPSTAVDPDAPIVETTVSREARGSAQQLPFGEGDVIYRELQTSQGLLDIAAEVRIEGGTLHLKDIAVYPQGAERFSLGPREILALRNQLAREAAALGFDKLRITGTRLTGANPGKVPDLLINLKDP